MTKRADYGETCCNQLLTRTLSSNGVLGSPVAVSPGGTDASNVEGDGYQFAVSSDGALTFVWRRIFDQHGAHFQEDIEARSETPAGAFGPVQTLTPVFTSSDTHDPRRTTKRVHLEQVFVSPLGRGAALAYVTATQDCGPRSCTSPTRYAFMERSVVGNRAGSLHTLVKSTSADNDGRKPPGAPIAWTGEFFGSGAAALAIWQTRIPLPGARIGTGLGARSISTAGKVAQPTTPFAAGTLSGSYSGYTASVAPNGREVVVGATGRHGLEIETHS